MVSFRRLVRLIPIHSDSFRLIPIDSGRSARRGFRSNAGAGVDAGRRDDDDDDDDDGGGDDDDSSERNGVGAEAAGAGAERGERAEERGG